MRRKVVEKETEEVAMKGYTAWHQGEGYHEPHNCELLSYRELHTNHSKHMH